MRPSARRVVPRRRSRDDHRSLDIKVVVVVEGLDGTMNERGVQRTLLGISSDEDSLRTEMILKSAAVASWRIDHVDDPRRKRGGR